MGDDSLGFYENFIFTTYTRIHLCMNYDAMLNISKSFSLPFFFEFKQNIKFLYKNSTKIQRRMGKERSTRKHISIIIIIQSKRFIY